MTEYSGKMNAANLRIGIVVSRFNNMVTDRLLEGALDAFYRAQGSEENLTVVRVPGSFEIPGAAKKLAEPGLLDAIVCLGCLIRGETDHFDYLATAVTRGISELGRELGIPLTFGVITADTVEQAMNRAGLKYGNKGVDAMNAAIEMADLYRNLKPR